MKLPFSRALCVVCATVGMSVAIPVSGVACLGTRAIADGPAPSQEPQPAGRQAQREAQRAPGDPQPPASQFRGIFVTTAHNIDWPSKPGLHRRTQQDEIRAIVERARDLNCNVIMLQVRAFGDRLHRNTRLGGRYQAEPWSIALMPNPENADPDPHTPIGGFDPLAEWVRACGEADIELHAWVNPFRVNDVVTVTDVTDGNKQVRTLPVFMWDKQLWLDHDHPEVRTYVLAVVQDLVEQYGRGGKSLRQEDDGIDAIIYDHYMPAPPPGRGKGKGKDKDNKGKRPANGEQAPAEPAPQARQPMSRAERRFDFLKRQYDALPAAQKFEYPDPTPDLSEFIAASAAYVRGKGLKFGFSPHRDDERAKQWFSAGHFDYVVPELYVQRFPPGAAPNVNQFKQTLEGWLSAAPEPVGSHLVVAGLYTTRTQAPARHEEDEPWPEAEIRDQMTDVRTARGQQGKRADGEAHYAASGLRLSHQGGPRAARNLARALKLPGGHYEKPSVLPDPGVGPVPNTPRVRVEGTGNNRVVRWDVQGPRPKQWIVHTSRGGIWDPTPEVYERGQDRHPVAEGVDRVWVQAVSKKNRRSDFGKWPPQ